MNDVVKVEVQRSGRRFEAEAVLDLAADVQTVWNTITDYGALPRFMPGIRACRVVERQALAGARRATGGGAGRRIPLPALRAGDDGAAERRAPAAEDGRGQGRALRPRDVSSAAPSTSSRAATNSRRCPRAARRRALQLRYTALIGLRLPPPPAIGNVAVRQNLAAQLEAVAAEVARRSGR